MLPARGSFDTAVERLHQDIDRTFGRLWRGWEDPELGEWTTAYPCDMREEGEQIIVEAELPGFTKEQIQVNVEQGVLMIEAHREEKQEEEKGKGYLSERRYAHVRRSFRLPKAVDEDKVEGHLENGVLTLRMPKREEAKAKRIEVT